MPVLVVAGQHYGIVRVHAGVTVEQLARICVGDVAHPGPVSKSCKNAGQLGTLETRQVCLGISLGARHRPSLSHMGRRLSVAAGCNEP